MRRYFPQGWEEEGQTMMPQQKATQGRRGNFFVARTLREGKEAGTMLPTTRGASSPWFTGRAQKPGGEEVSLKYL